MDVTYRPVWGLSFLPPSMMTGGVGGLVAPVLGVSVLVFKVLVNSPVVSFPSRMVTYPVSRPLPSSPLLMLKAVVYLEPGSAISTLYLAPSGSP